MEEIDGIETAKEIRKITKDVFIVFVTAFITYALKDTRWMQVSHKGS